MRRGRILIYLALLLIVGVAAVVWLGPKLLGQGTSNGNQGQEIIPTATPILTVDVVVVVQSIPLGAEVKAEYLGTVPIPQDTFVEGLYMTDIAKAVGRLAKYELQPRVFLNETYLVESLDQAAASVSELSFMIDKGKVAVSIPITRLSSISYAPKRGDHVNVIVTLMFVDLDPDFQSKLPNFTAGVLAPGPSILLGYSQQDQTTASLTSDEKQRSIAAQVVGGGIVSNFGRSFADPTLEQTFYLVPSEEQRPRLVSQTLIQDVKVLQVGTYKEKELPEVKPTESPDATPTPVPPAGQPQSAQPTPEPERPDLITLVVTPQDAVTLNYLLYSGAQLTLALRPVGDTDVVETQAVTLKFLLENYRILRPERMDIGIEPRVDKLEQPKLPNDKAQPTPIP